MYKVFDPKQANELLLQRQGWLSPKFVLTDNYTNTYGKLVYQWLSKRTVMAESATNRWIFRLGFIFTRSIIITDETGEEIGEAKREFFTRRTILTLRTGFTAEFYRPFIFSRERIWEARGYGTILRMRSYPFLFKDVIEIKQSIVPPNMIPLLIFLGAHLTILRRRRIAAR